MYDLCHMHIMSFSSYNGCKLNSHLTSQEVFIAQLAEHHINIVEVMGLNPVGAFFSGLSLQLLKLLHKCEDHFHFYSILLYFSNISQSLLLTYCS